MKPVVFDPQDRPQIELSSLGTSQSTGSHMVSLVEIHLDYLVVSSSFSLDLRGQVTFQDQKLNFVKNSEEQVQETFYSYLKCSQEDTQMLVTHFLARLSPELLTNWLLSSMPSQHTPLASSTHLLNPLKEGVIGKSLTRILCFLYDLPWVALTLLVLLSIVPAMHIKKLVIDASLERIHVKGSQELVRYEESVELFGSDKAAILFFQDEDIFSREKLKILRKLAWDLQ